MSRSLLFLLLLVGLGRTICAHDGLDLQPPVSVPEAWNVITLCHLNIKSLAAQERWVEIPIQASLSVQALRYLRETDATEAEKEPLRVLLQDMEQHGLTLFNAARGRLAEETKTLLGQYSEKIAKLETFYDEKVVHAAVYSCPMCRFSNSLDPKAPCLKCGMALEPRTIPASDVYNTPGEPSITLKPKLSSPLTVGKASEVKIRFARKKDGVPVEHKDLRVVHTEPIHLLIIDESLSDYHHEHPKPTEVPGEFVFTITPRKPGPYRVFADLVPLLSNMQEYAWCDLPGSTKGESLSDRAVTTSSWAEPLSFQLKWKDDPTFIREKEPITAFLTVNDSSAQPFTKLEPVMGAFAHIVEFYEDRQTVLHIHPEGAEPQSAEERGGPALKFRFYAPKEGFIRLYVQVQVDGKQVFAPFGVMVVK